MISRLVSYVLAGLFLGLSLMTYMAARVLPIVFVAVLGLPVHLPPEDLAR